VQELSWHGEAYIRGIVVKECIGPVKLLDLSRYGAQSDRDSTQSRQRSFAMLEFVDQGSRRKDGPTTPCKNVSPGLH